MGGSPVKCEWVEPGKVVCENRRAFEATDDLQMIWRLLRNGISVEQGEMSPRLQAGERMELAIPLQSDTADGAEWHLSLNWSLAEATDWADAGHCLAWDQFALASAPAEVSHHATGLHGAAKVEIADAEILFDGKPILASAITPCLWRAPTDNDGGKPGTRPLFQSKTSEWVGYGLDALVPGALRVAPTTDGTEVTFERDWSGADGEALQHKSTWHACGDHVRIQEALIIPEAWKDLPRIGVRFEIPERYQKLEWFGLGPDESYPDRCGAQTIGVWSLSVAEQYHPYVRPQEYGAHEKCRWFRLLDEQGSGLQVTLPKPLSYSARPHHDVDLNAAQTLAELAGRNTTEVHIDIGVRGLGTAACGPDALPEYLIGPGKYQFTWTIHGIRGGA